MTRVIFLLSATAIIASCGAEDSSSLQEQVEASDAANETVGDGPFGLNLTDGPESLDVDPANSTPDNGFYLLNSVPSPASEFDSYAVVAFDDIGICEIRSVTQSFENDSLGTSVMALADTLSESLSVKYGEPEKLDACAGGSVICERQFWAMAVMDGQRAYGYEWRSEVEGVRTVYLGVTSDDLARLSLRLDYETGDADACADAVNNARAANL